MAVLSPVRLGSEHAYENGNEQTSIGFFLKKHPTAHVVSFKEGGLTSRAEASAGGFCAHASSALNLLAQSAGKRFQDGLSPEIPNKMYVDAKIHGKE